MPLKRRARRTETDTAALIDKAAFLTGELVAVADDLARILETDAANTEKEIRERTRTRSR